MTNLDTCYNYWLFKIDKFSRDFLRLTNLDGLNLSLLKIWQSEFVWASKSHPIQCQFCSQDKFRCSKYVIFKKRTNSDVINLSFLKKDKLRPSKFDFVQNRTNSDTLNLSFGGKTNSEHLNMSSLKRTNLGHIDLSSLIKRQI